MTFLVRVERDHGTVTRIDVLEARRDGKSRVVERIGTLKGLALDVARPYLAMDCERAGYTLPENSQPSLVPEPLGVRLALYALALSPIESVERLERVARGLHLLTENENEAYYWYGLCPERGTRACTALRILVG